MKSSVALSRSVALMEGLVVAVLWASSAVLAKLGLRQEIGPLTLAGLRYFLAALVLLPFALCRGNPVRSLSPSLWLRLLLMGISAYTVGNGAFFLGLQYLPATTISFLLNCTPLLVLGASLLWLRESPTGLQVLGVIVALAGGTLFFSPGLKADELLGLGIMGIGLVGFALFSILGRTIARDQETDTLTLTLVPLVAGGGLLLVWAALLEGIPAFSVTGGGIVLWLALVNTALAYVLYNRALRVLTALEINMLLNLSPLGTAAFAWALLGERLSVAQIVGMLIVILGVTLVQWKWKRLT
jgi:drug/metabolite transporter (DMT)-like permease